MEKFNLKKNITSLVTLVYDSVKMQSIDIGYED